MTNTNTNGEKKMTELRIFQHQPDSEGKLSKRKIRWNARWLAWKILQAKKEAEENKK